MFFSIFKQKNNFQSYLNRVVFSERLPGINQLQLTKTNDQCLVGKNDSKPCLDSRPVLMINDSLINQGFI